MINCNYSCNNNFKQNIRFKSAIHLGEKEGIALMPTMKHLLETDVLTKKLKKMKIPSRFMIINIVNENSKSATFWLVTGKKDVEIAKEASGKILGCLKDGIQPHVKLLAALEEMQNKLKLTDLGKIDKSNVEEIITKFNLDS
jgi:hypothetical protein